MREGQERESGTRTRGESEQDVISTTHICLLSSCQFPLMIADADDFIDLPKKSQQAVCDVLFAAVSWCREIISQFSMVADTSIEIRGKLITRLEHMLEIEGELAAFAGILSDWVRPASALLSLFLKTSRSILMPIL